MNNQLGDEQGRPLHAGRFKQVRDDNLAWALKWDGAALAALRERREEQDKWDRP